MMVWILLIHISAKSLHSNDSYLSVIFNSKTACEKKAAEINNEGECLNSACMLKESYESAECIRDSEEKEEK